MEIGKVDENLKRASIEDKPVTQWYDVRKAPFQIYGLYDVQNQSVFRRMPYEVASKVSEDVELLSEFTAGGRVRFSTDSPYVALRAAMPEQALMPHMSPSGSSGFDLYVDEEEGSRFVRSFLPNIKELGGIETYVRIEGTDLQGKMNSYTVNFPLYDRVKSLEIGILKGSRLESGAEYRRQVPFVYYGGSITQGGCASRPGNAYPAIISRRFQADYINLGFSGSAKGEQEMIDYLCGLDASVFICDDYNVGDLEIRRKTQNNIYKCYREAHPETPFIIVGCPFTFFNREMIRNRRFAEGETFRLAKEAGDEHIYYLSGDKLFEGMRYEECTVDGLHPTDVGFWKFGQVLGDLIEKIL